MTTVLQLLLVLGLMVLVHEFGHFVVAKWCGVRVETFAIGFGKRVVGFVRGGTDYRINALPLGGYVKMAGEIPGEETTNDPGDLNNHPRWQRMLIALAGPFANFVLAFVLMAGVYMVHNEVNQYESGPAVTDYISPGSPVAKTGIHAGDTIVHFDNVENPTWDDVLNHAALNLNQTVPFSYRSRRPARQHQLPHRPPRQPLLTSSTRPPWASSPRCRPHRSRSQRWCPARRRSGPDSSRATRS